jgi:hypothetical protein
MAPRIIGAVLVNQTRVRRLSPPTKPKSNLNGCSRSGWRPGWSNESPAREVIIHPLPISLVHTARPGSAIRTPARPYPTAQPCLYRDYILHRGPTAPARAPGEGADSPMMFIIMRVAAPASLSSHWAPVASEPPPAPASSPDTLPLVPCHHPRPGAPFPAPAPPLPLPGQPWGAAAPRPLTRSPAPPRPGHPAPSLRSPKGKPGDWDSLPPVLYACSGPYVIFSAYTAFALRGDPGGGHPPGDGTRRQNF